MKDYKRLTKWVINKFSQKPEADLKDKDSEPIVAITRLAELEDKIESGELIDRDEYIDRLMVAKDISGMTDKELEFFVKHNAKVRKETAKEFADEFKRRYFFMMTTYMKDPIYQCTGDELDRLVKEVCGE